MNGYDDYSDRRKSAGGYVGRERRDMDIFQMVMDHHAQIAQISADIGHIKSKIDNGLSEKMEGLSKRLDNLDRDSWATHLLSGGMKKLIGLIIFLILANALASNAMLAIMKSASGDALTKQEMLMQQKGAK